MRQTFLMISLVLVVVLSVHFLRMTRSNAADQRALTFGPTIVYSTDGYRDHDYDVDKPAADATDAVVTTIDD